LVITLLVLVVTLTAALPEAKTTDIVAIIASVTGVIGTLTAAFFGIQAVGGAANRAQSINKTAITGQGNGTPSTTPSELEPSYGPHAGSTVVSITGNGLSGANAVNFGSIPGENFKYGNDGVISATSPPAGDRDKADVNVIFPDPSTPNTKVGTFYYYTIDPSHGGGGQSVTILGSAAGVTAVKFGPKEVAATVDPTLKKLSVTTPSREDAGNSDDVDVTLIYPSNQPTNSFVVGKYHYDAAIPGSGPGSDQATVIATRGGIDRRQFAQELGDPALVKKAADMVKGEVGWNAPLGTKIVQLETAFNRAMARGQSLAHVLLSTSEAGQLLGNPQLGYYQGGSNGTYSRPVNDAQFADFKQNILREVYTGSNRSEELCGFIATGNASPPESTRQYNEGMLGKDLPSGMSGHPESYFQEGPFHVPLSAWKRFQGGESLTIPFASSPTGPVAPSPTGPAADPSWLVKARTFIGFQWASGAAPQQIIDWLNLIKTKFPNIPGLAAYCDGFAAATGEFPWCGVFAASMLAEAGLPPVWGPTENDRFALAVAWDVYGTKVDIENGELPQPGDIMRFTWPSGGHHVTFYDHPVETDDLYHCCGGNQDHNVVNIETMAMSAIRAVRRPPAAAAAPPAAAAAPAAAGAASPG
jgi:hypothetical protein